MEQLTINVANKLNLPKSSVAAVLTLLTEGATIPFIARYRKDKTGAMDEVQIQNIQDEARFQKEFSDRKLFIETTITEQQKMTEEIQAKLNSATTLNELEDIYLPYKPKRKTKAQTARENGLQPLADFLLSQNSGSLKSTAEAYLNDVVKTIEDALQGARDIVSETINEDADLRNAIRQLFEQQAQLQTKVLADMEEKGVKFKDYFAFSEPIFRIPSHRILAAMRGFMEGVLRLSISPSEEEALAILERKTITTTNETTEHLKKAIKDGYRRLLQPSLESEFRMALKTRADEEAINVFAENLRQLLLSSPLGGKKILALDPGYRTGCKVVCLDERGELLQTDLIFIHEKNHKLTEAEVKVKKLVSQHSLQAIAVGDGTAGRETEQFLKRLHLGLPIFLVNEDGASVYSASETARQEFPDQDVTVRGAVSIGRRLMDPLAELVKIDPKSIGVGQYQHDVNQIRLKERLDQTVESCVNAVGVNLNTASKHLLSYVSGIGPSIAENIVRYRNEHGGFKNRKQLLDVPRLGAKAYEQCAGFLRVKNSDNPLDASAVHPESYAVVQQMATDLHVALSQLIGNSTFVNQIAASKYVSETVGAHTVQDILRELKKPGLDPRSEAQAFEFADIYSLEDVHVGMIVPGVVTNLTRFGAFIDIGVKQDGLVHVSEISHQYITDPNEALKLNDKVMAKVLEVDTVRKRISLSIKQTIEAPQRKQSKRNDIPKTSHQPTNLNDALGLLKAKFKK
ncbi:MAG: RNA-binding transcriptional accessory protein [Bacteroidetes bacterium]|nr:RNA-binding transcriptional accessory protein [Bacteroidota bacterium]